jgi:hypothetical protein
MLVVPWMANIFLSRLHQNMDNSTTTTRIFMILLALADAYYKF